VLGAGVSVAYFKRWMDELRCVTAAVKAALDAARDGNAPAAGSGAGEGGGGVWLASCLARSPSFDYAAVDLTGGVRVALHPHACASDRSLTACFDSLRTRTELLTVPVSGFPAATPLSAARSAEAAESRQVGGRLKRLSADRSAAAAAASVPFERLLLEAQGVRLTLLEYGSGSPVVESQVCVCKVPLGAPPCAFI